MKEFNLKQFHFGMEPYEKQKKAWILSRKTQLQYELTAIDKIP